MRKPKKAKTKGGMKGGKDKAGPQVAKDKGPAFGKKKKARPF